MVHIFHSLEKVLILAYSTRIVSKWPIFVFYRTYLGAAIFSRTATPACKLVSNMPRLAVGVFVCKQSNDGCGFAIPVRLLNGAQQTGGTVSCNALEVRGNI